MLILSSISYVRFDGQMSAKRRQETIARFSVPIREDAAPATSATDNARTTRQRKRTKTTTPDDEVVVLDDDGDGDFVMSGGEDNDDFIGDNDDKPSKKKRKGKGKGKQREHATPISDDMIFNGTNPTVMLISLKAGALGLNLTVANNVYL